MASMEPPKIAPRVDTKVIDVNDRIKVEGEIRGAHADVHDIGNKAQDLDDQLDHVNRSLSLQPLLHILRFRPLHRKPAQGSIFSMAFAIISIHRS
jgi:hypothetical protein